MRFPEVERVVLDMVEALVSVGVSRFAAEQAAKAAEEVAMLDIIETQADMRLLDLFDQYGSAVLAERREVCQKTVRAHYNEAAGRLARKEIGRNGSARLAVAEY